MTLATKEATIYPLWAEELASRPDRARIRARIGGLHCSLCTSTIEKALGRRPGVDKVAVSLTHEQALVEYDPAIVDPGELLKTLRDIGYTLRDPRQLRHFHEDERDLVREGRRFLVAVTFSLVAISLIAEPTGIWSLALPILASLGLIGFVFLVLRANGVLVAVTGAIGLGALAGALLALKGNVEIASIIPWLVGGLAIVLVFGVGRHILTMAFQALRRGILNQHVLLEVGAFAGIAGGTIGLVLNRSDYPTAPFFAVAVMVVTYHLFSEWLSLILKTRSSQAVARLLDLQPDTALVLCDGREVEAPIETVRVGDLVRIRPGEHVPVDGEVVEGHSSVDQALVTGEPVAVERVCGSLVVGGSINGTGTLVVRVSAVGAESFLQRVAREVEDARALKPGILHLVDRVLVVYSPAVLLIAVVAVIGWSTVPWLLGSQPDLQRAIFAGLSVLVMGYPCAVGISAPLSIVRGAGEAAERGVLMRTGEAFQGYRLVKQIAFDKTGTLTEGRPKVTEVEPIEIDAEELLGITAAVESSSEHPLADAILTAAFEAGITPPGVANFEAVPGKGVVAEIDGQRVIVGNPRFLVENGIALDRVSARIDALEAAGCTVIVAGCGKRCLGLVALSDTLRTDAAEVVQALKIAGLSTRLITGDNVRAAHRTALALGIDDVHASVLPGEKAEIIRQLQADGRVAMVGDGINDAPALMQADIGIAMGGGSNIAIDSADIVILSNQLEGVVVAHQISRRSYRKMLQNVSLAFLFNGIGVPLAATGLIYPVWAMAAMAASVTTIFVNSLWGRQSLFFQAILNVGKPIDGAS